MGFSSRDYSLRFCYGLLPSSFRWPLLVPVVILDFIIGCSGILAVAVLFGASLATLLTAGDSSVVVLVANVLVSVALRTNGVIITIITIDHYRDRQRLIVNRRIGR